MHSASSASGRPLRNAVKRHSVLSPELDPERAAPPPPKGASARGTSRPRGRPRASIAKARVISPPQARVIAPPPPYVEGEDGVTMEAASPHALDQSDTRMEEPVGEHELVGEHLPAASAPPVAESGRGSTEPLENEQRPRSLEPRSHSQPLSESNEIQEGNSDPTNGINVLALGPEVKSPPALPNHAAAISSVESATDVPVISSDTPASSLQLPHQELQIDNMVVESAPFPVTWPSSTSAQAVETQELTTTDDMDADADADADEDADAEADIDEDQDAEGEQEDDVEGEASDVPSRSKSPPPPDPPPPGPDSGPPPGNDDSEPDADADADAEGDMDLEEGEEAGGGSHASGMQQIMKLQLRSPGHGVLLEAAIAPVSSCARSALKGKSRRAGGLVDMCAKQNDCHVMPGKVSPVISLEQSSGEALVKWGKDDDIFLPTVSLNNLDVPIGCLGHSKSEVVSSWCTAGDPNIENLIWHATHCEPPFRPHVPSIHPIIEVS
ncbi:hypothetical protein BJ912DRAFT_970463 [Pholiota molesta]|nr:hypothetical protein BJ912DRAFT_970463 [Pholiota molesta]